MYTAPACHQSSTQGEEADSSLCCYCRTEKRVKVLPPVPQAERRTLRATGSLSLLSFPTAGPADNLHLQQGPCFTLRPTLEIPFLYWAVQRLSSVRDLKGEKEDKDITFVRRPQMDAGNLSWPFLGPDPSPIFCLEMPHSAPTDHSPTDQRQWKFPSFHLSKQGKRIPTNFRGKPTMCKLTDSWNTNQDHFLYSLW